MLTHMSMMLLYRKAQLCFTELVQMLLFLSASVTACTKERSQRSFPQSERRAGLPGKFCTI